MIDFSNKWKFLSFGLMAILATGLLAPQAFADATKGILAIVTNIQSQVNDPSVGLQAIQNNVNTKASQSSVNNVQTTANSIQNVLVNGSTTKSLNNIQTTANQIQTTTSTSLDKIFIQDLNSTGLQFDIHSNGTYIATVCASAGSFSADLFIYDRVSTQSGPVFHFITGTTIQAAEGKCLTAGAKANEVLAIVANSGQGRITVLTTHDAITTFTPDTDFQFG